MSATRSDEAPPRDPPADQADRSADVTGSAARATAGTRPTLSLEVIGVAVAVGLGVAARFVVTSPLWLDEALSVNIAGLPLADIPEALRHDGHPPLYYVILHGWIRIFGAGDVAVRFLSALFGLAALALLGLAARRAAGARAAGAALLIGAIAPFAVRYSTEARMYSLVMALVAAGYLAVRWALDRPGLGRLALVTLVSGALLLTHYWAMWLVAATIGVLGWQAVRRPGTDRAPKVRVAAAVAAGGILLLPWLPGLLDQAANTGTPWGDPVRPTAIVHLGLQDFGSASTGVALAEGTLFGLAVTVLFLVGLLGRTVDDRRLEIDVRTVPDVRSEAARRRPDRRPGRRRRLRHGHHLRQPLPRRRVPAVRHRGRRRAGQAAGAPGPDRDRRPAWSPWRSSASGSMPCSPGPRRARWPTPSPRRPNRATSSCSARTSSDPRSAGACPPG